MNDAEIPASWSQLATDIVVSKYFRKAGVPQVDAAGKNKVDASGKTILGPERSVKQVVHRLAGCWKHWGEKFGYFATAQDAQAFYNEISWMLLNQVAAPNSPQWFNTGLQWAYGINGPAQGHWIADHATGDVSLATDLRFRHIVGNSDQGLRLAHGQALIASHADLYNPNKC